MNPFQVGDRVRMVHSFPRHNAHIGDIAQVVDLPSSVRIMVKWETGTASHVGPWHIHYFEKGGAPMSLFECPKCGSTSDFVENWVATNHSIIASIDFDTGHIEWTGESILGDKSEHVNFECTNCNTTFTKADLDPVARIAAALHDLDDLIDDETGEEQDE